MDNEYGAAQTSLISVQHHLMMRQDIQQNQRALEQQQSMYAAMSSLTHAQHVQRLHQAQNAIASAQADF